MARQRAGRTASGRLKKGFRLLKGGRVVKARGARRKSSTTTRRKTRRAAPRRRAASKARPRARKRRRRTTMAVASHKRRTTRRAPRRRPSTYRRNPKMNIANTITRGAVDALQVTAGKGLARSIPTALGLPQSGAAGIAVQVAVAVALGMGADKVLGRAAGRMVVAGALSAPIESIVATAGIPFLSDALGRYPRVAAGVGRYPTALPGMAGYPHSANGAVGRYPAGNGMVYAPS